VVELPTKINYFNSNHEINGDKIATTGDAMEMPILPANDLEAVLNSLSSGKQKIF
jgi:hypothetical protein